MDSNSGIYRFDTDGFLQSRKMGQIKVWLILVLALVNISCASPGIKATTGDNYIQIAPIESKGIKGLFSWLFKPKLPSGTYKTKIDGKELEINTKKDLKLIDINFNAKK